MRRVWPAGGRSPRLSAGSGPPRRPATRSRVTSGLSCSGMEARQQWPRHPGLQRQSRQRGPSLRRTARGAQCCVGQNCVGQNCAGHRSWRDRWSAAGCSQSWTGGRASFEGLEPDQGLERSLEPDQGLAAVVDRVTPAAWSQRTLEAWHPRIDSARAVVRAATGVLLFGAVAVLVGLAVSLYMRGA